MLMTRLPNEPEEEEPKTTDPRRRLELGNRERGAGGAEDGRTAEAEEEALSPKPPAESGFS